MPEPSAVEFALAIEKLRSHTSPDIDQIPSELIKAGGRTVCYEIRKLIISIRNKEELPEEWKESIIVPVYKKGDCSNGRGHITFGNYVKNFIHHPAVTVNSIRRGNYWGSSMWILTQQVNY